MKKLSIFAGALLSLFVLNACDNEIPEQSGNKQASDGRQYIFTAGDYDWEELGESRSALNITPNGATFAWAEGDTIGIVPNEGSQVYFAINPQNAGSNQAAFSGGAWGMKQGSEFAAYYPFVHDIMLDRTQIPVDYTGQVLAGQTGANLGDYDYMVARPQEANENGNVNFNFEHLGCVIWLEFTVPTPGDVKQLILTSDANNPVFPVTGTIDLTQDPIAITHTQEDLSNFISFDVENLTTTTENQKVSVYFMMPPVDLSNKTLGLTVVRGDGEENIRLQVAGKNLQAKLPYKLTATEYQGGYYNESVINYQFNQNILKELEKKGGSKLRFVTNSSVTTKEQLYYYNAPAYAIRNGEWLEIHTPAKKFTSLDLKFNANTSYLYALLTEIDLSDIDFSMMNSMSYMFYNCSLLEKVTFDKNTNISAVIDMNYMFYACKSLKSVDLSGFNTENLKYVNSMFSDCESLTSIEFGDNFNTANVTDMSFMFNNCMYLESLVFNKNFNTSNVMYMSSMFNGCQSLKSLDLSNFNTENVKAMDAMFNNCYSFTSLDVSNFNTENVQFMGSMFYGCHSLKSLDVSNFNTENVINMSNMFASCSSLTSLDVSGFNTENVTTMYNMFRNCTSLTSLDVSGFNTEKVTEMDYMFYNCSSLTSLDVSGFNTENVTWMSNMFQNCSSLTSLDVSNFNTENVKYMQSMFYSCSSLTALDLSNFNTINVLNINSMFRNCYNLKELDLSSFSFGSVSNSSYIFSQTGKNSTNKPISIYVNEAGLTYLASQNTQLNTEYAKLVKK